TLRCPQGGADSAARADAAGYRLPGFREQERQDRARSGAGPTDRGGVTGPGRAMHRKWCRHELPGAAGGNASRTVKQVIYWILSQKRFLEDFTAQVELPIWHELTNETFYLPH